MNKHNVVYPYKSILFSRKKEWGTDTCCNMDEPWKQAKWKMPITKGHIVYSSSHMEYTEWANS